MIVVACTIVFLPKLQSQDIEDYKFLGDRCSYVPLESDGLQLSGGCLDYGFYNGIQIGFPFIFLNQEYTTLSISINGMVVLGRDLTFAGDNNNDLSDFDYRPILAPFWDDLIMNSNSVSYELIGNAPNRVFVVQWKDIRVGFFGENDEPSLSMQLKLYESSGRIEFAYRREPGQITSAFGASVGIAGIQEGRGGFISLQDISDNPEASLEREMNVLRELPATNQLYAFYPSTITSESLEDYEFEAYSESFVEITSQHSRAEVIYPEVEGTLDEGIYNNLPIGFRFNFLGGSFTTFSASTNGWMTLGSEISSPAPRNSLTEGDQDIILAPLWDDLDLSEGTFSYSTFGISPHRILGIQWQRAKWDKTAEEPVLSFQVKLFESDGSVEFFYSDEGGELQNASASIGIAKKQEGKLTNKLISAFSDNERVENNNISRMLLDDWNYVFYLQNSFLVSNLNASGSGSLQNAFQEATNRFGKSFILFNIRESAPWIIQLETPLPDITPNTYIIVDATSQYNWSPETPIIVDGTNMAANPGDGVFLKIYSDSVEAYGFQVQGFEKGIKTYGTTVPKNIIIGKKEKPNYFINNEVAIELEETDQAIVEGNIIGFNNQGESFESQQIGILLSNCSNSIIRDNIISGNSQGAIAFRGTTRSEITNNILGLNQEKNRAINNSTGVHFYDGAENNTIRDNTIAGSLNQGILLQSFSGKNQILNNTIGSLNPELSNQGKGIEIKSNFNTIGSLQQPNRILNNQRAGIAIEGQKNTITSNSIYCNTGEGIELRNNGNASKQPPMIHTALRVKIEGTSSPRDRILIYKNRSCKKNQGEIYISEVRANGEGEWEYLGGFEEEDYITALAIDQEGNTSSFSVAREVTPDPSIYRLQPLSAQIGEEITIEGKGLSIVDSVYFFEGLAADFEIENDTRIRATIPQGASTGAIILLSVAGTTSSGTFICIEPEPPTNLNISSSGLGQITLEWVNSASNSTNTLIERSDNDDKNFRLIDEIFPEIATYTDRNIIPGLTYFYRVKSKNDCNFEAGSYSNTVGAVSSDIITTLNPTQTTKYQIYPNPSREKIYIDILKRLTSEYKVSMYSQSGKKIKSPTLFKENHFEIDVKNIPEGIYFIELSFLNKVHRRKILINK